MKFEILPPKIQSGLEIYAQATELSVSQVIEAAIAAFIEFEGQLELKPYPLQPQTSIFQGLPPSLKTGIQTYIQEVYDNEDGYDANFIIESAIITLFNPDCTDFADFETEPIGVQPYRVELLQQYATPAIATAA